MTALWVRKTARQGFPRHAELAGPVRCCSGGVVTRGPNDGATWLSCRPAGRAWQRGLWPGLAIGADVANAGERALGAAGGGAGAASTDQLNGPAGAGTHRSACTGRARPAGATDRVQCQRLCQGLPFIPGGGLQLPADRRSAPAVHEITTTERTPLARISIIFLLLGR